MEGKGSGLVHGEEEEEEEAEGRDEEDKEEDDQEQGVQEGVVLTSVTVNQDPSLYLSTRQAISSSQALCPQDAGHPYPEEGSGGESRQEATDRLDPFQLLAYASSPGMAESGKRHLALLVPDETAQTPCKPLLPSQRSRDVQQEQRRGRDNGLEGQGEERADTKTKVFLFPDFGLDPSLLMSLEMIGLKIPSPVQVSAIPLALQGRSKKGAIP